MRKLSVVSFATPAIAALLLAGCASTGKPVVEQTIQLSHPVYLLTMPKGGGLVKKYARFGSVKVQTSGELALDSAKLWFLAGTKVPIAWDDLYQITQYQDTKDKNYYYLFSTRADHDAGKTKMQGIYEMSLYLCANGHNPAEAKDQCAKVVSADSTEVYPQTVEMPDDRKRTWNLSPLSGNFVFDSWQGSTAAEYEEERGALITKVELSKRAAAAAETRRREEYAEEQRQARAFFKGAKAGTQISCSSIGWMARMEMPSDRTVFNCQQAGTILYRDLQSNGWVVTNMIQQPGVDVRGDPISNYAISIRKVR